MKPRAGETTVEEVPSPLQCPALDYGSSFSRAAEIKGPGFRRVLVSGTASIDSKGETAHAGQVEAQMALTVEVVSAILSSRGMDFKDVVRGNAYYRDTGSTEAFEAGLVGLGLPKEKLLASRNPVCRADLLFELEVDAIRTNG
jgi:enamine deaminase RidA (YjgF/YER057c/UK114 family)